MSVLFLPLRWCKGSGTGQTSRSMSDLWSLFGEPSDRCSRKNIYGFPGSVLNEVGIQKSFSVPDVGWADKFKIINRVHHFNFELLWLIQFKEIFSIILNQKMRTFLSYSKLSVQFRNERFIPYRTAVPVPQHQEFDAAARLSPPLVFCLPKSIYHYLSCKATTTSNTLTVLSYEYRTKVASGALQNHKSYSESPLYTQTNWIIGLNIVFHQQQQL